MGSFSIWHWVIVLVVLGGFVYGVNLIVRSAQAKRTNWRMLLIDRPDMAVAAAASKSVHEIVRQQFEMADVHPFEIRKSTIQFTAGYIAGFSDVMAQANGAKAGQSLSQTICVRTMEELFGNELGSAMFMRTAQDMDSGSKLITQAMIAGGKDGNAFLRGGWTGILLGHLMEHKDKE